MDRQGYWIVVAMQDRVSRAMREGCIEVSLSKCRLLDDMHVGDWFVCYSPRKKPTKRRRLRKFTAIGWITGSRTFEACPDGQPVCRRDARYIPARQVSAHQIAQRLNFVDQPADWARYLQGTLLRISREDFHRIASEMTDHFASSVSA